VTVATFTDDNLGASAADFTATINWGDGSTSLGTVTETNTTTHVFSVRSEERRVGKECSSPVTVTINKDGGSAATATSTVTVNDAALHASGGAVNIFSEGIGPGTVTVATFTDDNLGASAADFTATINWGDGSTSLGTVTETNTTTHVFSV